MEPDFKQRTLEDLKGTLYSLKCDSCDDTFDNLKRFYLHRKLHKTNIIGPFRTYEHCPFVLDPVTQLELRRLERCSFSMRIFRRDPKKGAINNFPKFQCMKCDKSFAMKTTLKNHLISKHQDIKVFSCELCPRKFALATYLKSHMAVHKRQRMKAFKCDQCPKSFVTRNAAKHHMLVHVQDPNVFFQCDHCSKKFRFKRGLNLHLHRAHVPKNPHICPVCKKSYNDKKYLQVHLRTHTQPGGDYTCNYCGKQYFNSTYFRIHVSGHEMKEKFKCDKCPKVYKYKNGLLTHRKVAHEEREKLLCTKCPRTFNSKHNLARHLQSHENDRPCPYENCGLELRTKALLREHINSHGKAFKCRQCGKLFGNEENLKAHYSTHPYLVV
ncbi:unnamed protein product [Hermetia illucens]|uniref:C2H2-type domain-containing protein n=1 Tax=Hermetia illucens TaxID=343691 RepID=A0A7R8YPA6_HERIL|nr:zinc finger protein 888-like [Hermetia illucens]XP_037918419.1 zinc finger protein 888-like [Hermetia illucens]XP_037918424.1 zinc finger protein 888-like [Hermetia illucens]XP_037918430.1 zinc finger protein 888-like [Hermetia illucens]XP_037918437.1 zinc finger protein 888-like [Hermetia illucens]XP_037918444.1 zinc finger protein 888-like [Hermetia illucens]CAD7079290.1 unnamed protein product [Hermetia illucens]